MEQTCVTCGELKPLDRFPQTKSNKTGKNYWRHQCKACGEAVRAVKRKADLQRINAVRKKWRDAHPGHNRSNHKAWRDRNREHVNRESKLADMRRRYGMSPTDVEAMSIAQKGLCAACGGPPDDQRPLMIDHDHITGAVRGMLCNSCNLTLGRSRESVIRLSGLITYLERFRSEATIDIRKVG